MFYRHNNIAVVLKLLEHMISYIFRIDFLPILKNIFRLFFLLLYHRGNIILLFFLYTFSDKNHIIFVKIKMKFLHLKKA